MTALEAFRTPLSMGEEEGERKDVAGAEPWATKTKSAKAQREISNTEKSQRQMRTYRRRQSRR